VLQQTRQLGERAGLVVLATGLGKTYVSAFDSQPFRRVLFVAHREEILTQALETFRKVRPSARLGLYHGTQKDPHADVLFASIQTLSQDEHLESFDPTHFDDVLVDEFHHASAETYRRVLDHFEPKFLLGLTATPDRTDGANILSLCAGNEVYRADMPRGIEDGQLSAFRYFGIGDPTEYEKIPWRQYTNDRLAATVSIDSRAQHILESLDTHAPGRVRALVFCVTTMHADFMAEYFLSSRMAAHALEADGRGSFVRTVATPREDSGPRCLARARCGGRLTTPKQAASAPRAAVLRLRARRSVAVSRGARQLSAARQAVGGSVLRCLYGGASEPVLQSQAGQGGLRGGTCSSRTADSQPAPGERRQVRPRPARGCCELDRGGHRRRKHSRRAAPPACLGDLHRRVLGVPPRERAPVAHFQSAGPLERGSRSG